MPCHVIFHSINARQRIVKRFYLLYNLYVGWRVCATVCLSKGVGSAGRRNCHEISFPGIESQFHFIIFSIERGDNTETVVFHYLGCLYLQSIMCRGKVTHHEQNGTEHSLVSILSTRTWATQMRTANTCGQNCYFHY